MKELYELKGLKSEDAIKEKEHSIADNDSYEEYMTYLEYYTDGELFNMLFSCL